MTWDNFSAIMKLFFVLLHADISFRLKVKYTKHSFSRMRSQSQLRNDKYIMIIHFLSGSAKIESVSNMLQG